MMLLVPLHWRCRKNHENAASLPIGLTLRINDLKFPAKRKAGAVFDDLVNGLFEGGAER